MKCLSFSAILLAVLSLSCNKSHNTGSAYYIKATIDGVSKNFSGNVFATTVSNVQTNAVNINGLFSSSDGEGFNLAINSHAANVYITPGIYDDTSSVYTIALTYAPSATSTLYASGNLTSDSAAHNGVTIVNHLKVAISAVTSTGITGSFSGDIFLNGNAASDKKTVTEGTFFAKFQ
ncbi:MAG: hypothetical protein BGO55_15940 [Sphingobacteriales bacterium 50-39]|nr:hypothetical protein [Sphingobacteriales bacterium]OJW54849.1 MAG: hypothetical protein BGO55_15940 [Sphingobacteriales bacterium 50-39]